MAFSNVFEASLLHSLSSLMSLAQVCVINLITLYRLAMNISKSKNLTYF